MNWFAGDETRINKNGASLKLKTNASKHVLGKTHFMSMVFFSW